MCYELYFDWSHFVYFVVFAYFIGLTGSTNCWIYYGLDCISFFRSSIEILSCDTSSLSLEILFIYCIISFYSSNWLTTDWTNVDNWLNSVFIWFYYYDLSSISFIILFYNCQTLFFIERPSFFGNIPLL